MMSTAHEPVSVQPDVAFRRIVSWNCGGGYQKKAAAIMDLAPDLIVIQEITKRDAAAIDASFVKWTGPPGGKGVAVADFTGKPCSISRTKPTDLKWFLPLKWNGIHILATWATVVTPTRRYVRILHEALDHYARFLSAPQAIMMGDFNSGTVFDRKHGKLTHTALVERLEARGFSSAYHVAHGLPHGEELDSTFFLYRHPDRGYHLDYAFASAPLLPRSRLTLGDVAEWGRLSDHLPLILDIDGPGGTPPSAEG